MKLRRNICCCGHDGAKIVLFAASDRNFANTDAKGEVCRCESCGSVFPALFPAAESLPDAYENYYTRASHQRSGLRAMIHRMLEVGRSTYLDRSVPKSCERLLDFGAGSGEFLRRMKLRIPGVSLYGTDVVRPSNGVSGFSWIDLDRLASPGDRYDWITVSHVIEHAPDPRATLKLLSHLANEEGGIWISTPNAHSFVLNRLGEWARDVDFPRHRQIFALPLLARWLETWGFTVQQRSSPRLNTILNVASSMRNLLAADASAITKARLVLLTAVSLALHLLKPARFRDGEAPELVLIATRACNS